ncbi:hypothetical protein DERP_006989 [Dermatophagoides pteronyssinus]|uniref:Uncharacterized protein n=1 Tax=Dermatophagoides pteronyssinus TaxID=6956 RepID=A0ABQ8JTV8_DERPT|nr:hypothetical protein DERP_006989 [Dermatophagoides pteronyssinus]
MNLDQDLPSSPILYDGFTPMIRGPLDGNTDIFWFAPVGILLLIINVFNKLKNKIQTLPVTCNSFSPSAVTNDGASADTSHLFD